MFKLDSNIFYGKIDKKVDPWWISHEDLRSQSLIASFKAAIISELDETNFYELEIDSQIR